jgi:hypothetical protein
MTGGSPIPYYPKCRHALCGAHIARELTYFEELGEETKAWAGTLKELLLEMRLADLTVSYENLVAEDFGRSHRPKCPSMCAGKRATCCGWDGGRKRYCAS